jgi:hypothetical protein
MSFFDSKDFHIYNWRISFKAPYFLTISPTVQDLRRGYGAIVMKQHWGVQNHIKTVHAIAVCNLVEMTMGAVTEASIPAHLRWLPKGMDISYLKKAEGTLTATCLISDNLFELQQYPGDVVVPIEVKNAEGVVVTSAKVIVKHLQRSF